MGSGPKSCAQFFNSVDLEDGEVVQDAGQLIDSGNLVENRQRNFEIRSKKRSKRHAAIVEANQRRQAADDLAAQLESELAERRSQNDLLRASLESEERRRQQLEKELHDTEWKLISTERKLYVTSQPRNAAFDRVRHFLLTAEPPSDGDEFPCDAGERP